MGFNVIESVLGGDKDFHKDGSETERFADGTSVTRDEDGKVLEETSHEHEFFRDQDVTVTKDGDGHEINRQDR
jgi:hypothetical protein